MRPASEEPGASPATTRPDARAAIALAAAGVVEGGLLAVSPLVVRHAVDRLIRGQGVSLGVQAAWAGGLAGTELARWWLRAAERRIARRFSRAAAGRDRAWRRHGLARLFVAGPWALIGVVAAVLLLPEAGAAATALVAFVAALLFASARPGTRPRRRRAGLIASALVSLIPGVALVVGGHRVAASGGDAGAAVAALMVSRRLVVPLHRLVGVHDRWTRRRGATGPVRLPPSTKRILIPRNVRAHAEPHRPSGKV